MGRPVESRDSFMREIMHLNRLGVAIEIDDDLPEDERRAVVTKLNDIVYKLMDFEKIKKEKTHIK